MHSFTVTIIKKILEREAHTGDKGGLLAARHFLCPLLACTYWFTHAHARKHHTHSHHPTHTRTHIHTTVELWVCHKHITKNIRYEIWLLWSSRKFADVKDYENSPTLRGMCSNVNSFVRWIWHDASQAAHICLRTEAWGVGSCFCRYCPTRELYFFFPSSSRRQFFFLHIISTTHTWLTPLPHRCIHIHSLKVFPLP